jgi:hypothetical protein
MDEAANSSRSEAELQKLRLEVQKLSLDVANASRTSRFELLLRFLPSATVLVAMLGLAFTVWQYRVEQRNTREANDRQALKDSSERAAQAKKDTEAAQREFMKPLLEKQQALYFEAATVAAAIATTTDVAERRRAEARFWVLFWGPLVMVESQEVSGAMQTVSRCLTGEEKCSAEMLKDRSLKLASTLETSMLKTWNAKPGEFTANQFVYR